MTIPIIWCSIGGSTACIASLAGFFLGSPFGRLRTTRCPELHRSSVLTLVPSRVRFPDAHFIMTSKKDGTNPSFFDVW